MPETLCIHSTVQQIKPEVLQPGEKTGAVTVSHCPVYFLLSYLLVQIGKGGPGELSWPEYAVSLDILIGSN